MDDLGDLRARELLAKIRADSARIRRAANDMFREADRLDAAATALEGVIGKLDAGPIPAEPLEVEAAAVSANGSTPRGEEAVLRVMQEAPDTTWTAAEIHVILDGRRWISPDAKHPRAGTDAALGRLVKKGLVAKNEGLYTYMGGAPKTEA